MVAILPPARRRVIVPGDPEWDAIQRRRLDPMALHLRKSTETGHLLKNPTTGHLANACEQGEEDAGCVTACADCEETTDTCLPCGGCTPQEYNVEISGVTTCGCIESGGFSSQIEASTLAALNATHCLTQNAFFPCIWDKTDAAEGKYTTGTTCPTTNGPFGPFGLYIELRKDNNTTFRLLAYIPGLSKLLFDGSVTVASGECEGPYTITNDYVVGDCDPSGEHAYDGSAVVCPCCDDAP